MNTRASSLLLATIFIIAPARARADDDPKPGTPEAQAKSTQLFNDAKKHYGDADPKQCLELAEHALKLTPNDVQILAFLGTLHEIKTGEQEKALKYYDEAIRGLAGVTKQGHLKFKADIMARKANLLYAEKDDLKGAVELYQFSFETFQLSETAFKVSNLLHRYSGEQTEEAKKKDFAQKALKAAEQALTLIKTAPYTGDKAKAYVAKVRTQLALCLEAVGEKEKAARALEGLAQRDYDETCAYNQALLAAVRAKGDEATEHLKAFLKTRPTAKARNRLRKFIRAEPDFKDLLKRPDWKELVEDEPLDEKSGK